LPPGLTINTATGLISGTPTATGNYTVTITAENSLGIGSATLTIIVGLPGSIVDTGRIVNLSVLAPVNSANPIIAGFVVTGSGTQDILLRAVGPGLSYFSRTDGLANPTLRVFNQRTGATIHESTSWGGDSTVSAAFVRLGAFPLTATSADAAVLLKLAPGAYTFHVTAPGTTSGSALAEVYDASLTPAPSGSPRLINISARGVIAGGSQLVTSGFVISGTTPKRVLIRGIGPGLTPAPHSVPNALADTVVTLNKMGTGGGVIARNDNWETPVVVDAIYPAATGAQIAAAAVTTGAFSLATGSADSAILVTLPPGIYTAQVGSATNVTGAAMVEVYELP
jgi:PKD repeat protein